MSNFDEQVVGDVRKRRSKSKPDEMRASQRKQGRPHGGHVRVTQKRVDALDEITYEAKVARTLGIGRGTLAQWISSDKTKHPLPYVEEGGHKLFRKDAVLKWLRDTGRWIEREEYKS